MHMPGEFSPARLRLSRMIPAGTKGNRTHSCDPNRYDMGWLDILGNVILQARHYRRGHTASTAKGTFHLRANGKAPHARTQRKRTVYVWYTRDKILPLLTNTPGGQSIMCTPMVGPERSNNPWFRGYSSTASIDTIFPSDTNAGSGRNGDTNRASTHATRKKSDAREVRFTSKSTSETCTQATPQTRPSIYTPRDVHAPYEGCGAFRPLRGDTRDSSTRRLFEPTQHSAKQHPPHAL